MKGALFLGFGTELVARNHGAGVDVLYASVFLVHGANYPAL